MNHDEAIDLMLPGCQQGSPPDRNNSSDSSSNTSQQGKPYSANLAHLANLAYPVNPLSNLATPPANPASLPGMPPAIPANLLANPGNPPANIPANQANDLAQALTMLIGSIQAPHPATPQCTKIQEPDLFDGSDPKKLQSFLVQLELNFRD